MIITNDHRSYTTWFSKGDSINTHTKYAMKVSYMSSITNMEAMHKFGNKDSTFNVATICNTVNYVNRSGYKSSHF
jgi:hypothetical protein